MTRLEVLDRSTWCALALYFACRTWLFLGATGGDGLLLVCLLACTLRALRKTRNRACLMQRAHGLPRRIVAAAKPLRMCGNVRTKGK